MNPVIYSHYKGGLYRVLLLARESTNIRVGNDVVVYISLTTGRVHCRDLREFQEMVKWPDGKMRPRFNEVRNATFGDVTVNLSGLIGKDP